MEKWMEWHFLSCKWTKGDKQRFSLPPSFDLVYLDLAATRVQSHDFATGDAVDKQNHPPAGEENTASGGVPYYLMLDFANEQKGMFVLDHDQTLERIMLKKLEDCEHQTSPLTANIYVRKCFFCSSRIFPSSQKLQHRGNDFLQYAEDWHHKSNAGVW